MRAVLTSALASCLLAGQTTGLLAIIPNRIIDPRCCHASPDTIKRNPTTGRISRSAPERQAFVRLHACPPTGKHTTSCDGWDIDHIIPLASGGCDQVGNMQWLPNAIKSGAGVVAKDRWERRVYACWAKP